MRTPSTCFLSLLAFSAFDNSQSFQQSHIPLKFKRKLHLSPILSGRFFDISSTYALELSPALPDLPFGELAKELSNALDIGSALEGTSGISEATTTLVLESVGQDLLVFLAASVLVTPICTFSRITPILGYLIAGAILGPHGLDVFANTQADVELGDFGILFLLFSEGLEVSTQRLQKLTNYVPLAVAQISLTAGVLTAAILSLPQNLERFLPLDKGLINIQNPIEALVLALAGTLSTSAFVFPVLKEREWEEEETGQAATSILLIQDLFVAPLLVLLPYIVGEDPTDYSAIGFLTLKATVGFGLVVAAGSSILRRLFKLVASTRSTETFVATCLLVSAGMGVIAKSLGLTDTVGAFAAGVLLANTNYRAQIQADILPFKGILLGIFFMDAGTSFDWMFVVQEIPTILAAVFALLFLKASTMILATRVPQWIEPNRLSIAGGVKVAFLLAGGGEFAFVILAVAEKLGVLPKELGGLLTAVVLITMAVTPLLGSIAESFSNRVARTLEEDSVLDEAVEPSTLAAINAIVVCGYGEVGRSTLEALGKEFSELNVQKHGDQKLPRLVAFDNDPSLAESILMPVEGTAVLFGDGSNPKVIQNHGITEPAAIFVSYENPGRVLSATSRIRAEFPDTPLYTRAQTRSEAQSLQAAGATEIVVELDELSRSAVALMRDELSRSAFDKVKNFPLILGPEELRQSAAAAAGISIEKVDHLFEIFDCIDVDTSGTLSAAELTTFIRKSNKAIVSDEELDQMEDWIRTVVAEPIDTIEFCRLYERAPELLREGLSIRHVI
jgi:Kef-type K+ transport system membrane component KefB/voltage-gated potassium channel Kch